MPQTVSPDLRAAIEQRFASRMPYCTLARQGATDLAACCDVPADVRNSSGQTAQWAVWRQQGGLWACVFSFEATVDADEESARLDALFESHGLSADTRGLLMYSEERQL